jgi:hypothetical protein
MLYTFTANIRKSFAAVGRGAARNTFAGSFVALAVAVSISNAAPAHAASVNLENGNSSVTVNPSSQSGLSNYTVNGINTALQNWFWYRVGGTGPEQSIDALTLVSATPSAGDPSEPANNNVLDLQYAGAGFDLSVIYVLNGGDPSSLNTTVDITNTGSTDLDFHLFEYGDMTLSNGAPKSDTLSITGGNTIDQTGPAGEMNLVSVTYPSEVEAALGSAIKDSLNDGGPTTLSGATGPIAGDVTYGLEWDTTITDGSSYIASQAMTVDTHLNAIPLPKAAWMTIVGLATGALLLRKRLFVAL